MICRLLHNKACQAYVKDCRPTRKSARQMQLHISKGDALAFTCFVYYLLYLILALNSIMNLVQGGRRFAVCPCPHDPWVGHHYPQPTCRTARLRTKVEPVFLVGGRTLRVWVHTVSAERLKP